MNFGGATKADAWGDGDDSERYRGIVADSVIVAEREFEGYGCALTK